MAVADVLTVTVRRIRIWMVQCASRVRSRDKTKTERSPMNHDTIVVNGMIQFLFCSEQDIEEVMQELAFWKRRCMVEAVIVTHLILIFLMFAYL